MAAKSEELELRWLEEEFQAAKENLAILKGAEKTCTCGIYGPGSEKPHFHELIRYDAESGDEYYEESDVDHKEFIEWLVRRLQELEGQIAELKAKESSS